MPINERTMKKVSLQRFVIFLLASSLTFAVSAQNANPERGRQLYENHCQVCHTSQVHFRAQSKVKSVGDILYQINRWRTELELNWSAEEMADVLDYLNQRFYHFSAER